MEESVEIQCTLDDMNPEWSGWVLEELERRGAQDAYLMPVYKKKNRPAVLLSVLCQASQREEIVGVILAETTTLGLRWHAVHKERQSSVVKEVATPWGPVRIKVGYRGAEVANLAPEYEDCRELAVGRHIPLKFVYQAALQAAWEVKSEWEQSERPVAGD